MDLSLSKEYKNAFGSTYYVNSKEELLIKKLDVRYGMQCWEGKSYSLSVFNRLKRFKKLESEIVDLVSHLTVKNQNSLVKSGRNGDYVSLRFRPKGTSLECDVLIDDVKVNITTKNLDDFDTIGTADIAFTPSIFINNEGTMYISLKPTSLRIITKEGDESD